jgi:hypothetical protein
MPAMAIQNHGDRKNTQPLLGAPRSAAARSCSTLDSVRVTATATIVPRESMILLGTHNRLLRGTPSEVKTFGRWYHVKVSGKTLNRCCGSYETTGSVEPRSSAELRSRHLCSLRHGVTTGADVRHVEPFGPANKFCCPGPSFLFSGNDTLFY